MYISCVHDSKNKCCFNAKPSTYYFYLKTKIFEHFSICISVPLSSQEIVFYKVTSLFSFKSVNICAAKGARRRRFLLSGYNDLVEFEEFYFIFRKTLPLGHRFCANLRCPSKILVVPLINYMQEAKGQSINQKSIFKLLI